MSNTKHTVHIKLTAEEMKRCERAIKASPDFIQNKSDLFKYLLDSYCTTVLPTKKGTA